MKPCCIKLDVLKTGAKIGLNLKKCIRSPESCGKILFTSAWILYKILFLCSSTSWSRMPRYSVIYKGIPDGSVVKNLPAYAGDPWIGEIPWRRKQPPTLEFFLGNPMDRGAWGPTVHGLTRVNTHAHTHTHTHMHAYVCIPRILLPLLWQRTHDSGFFFFFGFIVDTLLLDS